MKKLRTFFEELFLESGENLYLALLFSLLFFSLILKLEIPVLPHHDDLTHACIGKMILKTGDWLTMHEGTQPSFLKPPLYFWAEALLFKIFGFTDYAARLPSALCGFGAVWVSFLISKKIFGRKAAVASLFVLLTSLFFWKYSRKAMLDVPVAFSCALAVYFFLKAEFEKKSSLYLLLGVAAAAGYYFKAIQGLYPLFIFPAYYAATGQFKKLFNPYFLFAYFLCGSLIALWFLPEYLKHGDQFLYSQCALGPIINRGIVGDSNSFFKPFLSLLGLNLPWGIFNLYGIWFSMRQSRSGIAEETKKGAVLLLIWFFFIMATLSVSKTYYIRYLLPAMLPFSIMGGAALANLLSEKYYAVVKKIVLIFFAVLFLKLSLFPLSPDSEKGTVYIGLYRTINSLVIDKSNVAIYKERFYVLNQGLSYYADITPTRHISDEKTLSETMKAGEVYVSNYADFYTLLSNPTLRDRVNLLASDRKKWAIFMQKK